jgi:hypothetical protein
VVDKKAIDMDIATPDFLPGIQAFEVVLDFKNIIHLKVLHQNVRNVCGFYAFYNSKCMLRHLISNEDLTTIVHDRE